MNRFSKAFLAVSLFAAGLLGPAISHAWDGEVYGRTISAFEVTQGNNYGFRVFLSGVSQMCAVNNGETGDAAGFAFLLETDSNYKVYVSMLMMAKATGANVDVFTVREFIPGTNRVVCHIGDIVVH